MLVREIEKILAKGYSIKPVYQYKENEQKIQAFYYLLQTTVHLPTDMNLHAFMNNNIKALTSTI